MTPEPQTQNQGSLTSKLTGVAVGAGATLTCLYNTPLIPYISLVGFGAAAGLGATGSGICAATCFVFGSAVYLGGLDVGFDSIVGAFGTATNIVATGLSAKSIANYLFKKHGERDTLASIQRFTASGLLTATALTGGYFVGRTQSDITDVIPQEQGITIKQADARTSTFQKQADGTYLLEQRLQK